MTQVLSLELQQQAHRVVIIAIKQAEQFFLHNFLPVKLKFNLRGRAAGKAYLQRNEIVLNPILFKDNQQEFLQQVIIHELVHLLVYQLYGIYNGTKKIKPHGEQWRFIMQQVYGLSANIYHSFDISDILGKQFKYYCRYKYLCIKNNYIHLIM